MSDPETTTGLLAHALALGGEYDGEHLTFTDSFQTVRFTATATGHGLFTLGGIRISTQTELHQLLKPTPHLNEAGLTTGTLISRLGVLDFAVTRAQISERDPSWEFRVKLSTERPLCIHGLHVDSVSIHTCLGEQGHSLYGNSQHVLMGGTQKWRGGSELPDKFRRVLAGISQSALSALLTPAARHAAQRTETEARILKAQRILDAAQATLDQLRQELDHHNRTQPEAA